MWELWRSRGSACLPAARLAVSFARSRALFIVVVPQPLAPPPTANRSGGGDEWQPGPPTVSRGGRGAGRPRSAMLGSSGRRPGSAPPLPRERGMDPQVNLRVSCRGETQSFLVSDSAHTTWADVEAMVSAGRPACRGSGAEGPQPRGALSVRRRQRQRLSEGPASPLSPSRALSAISWAVDLVFPSAAASALAGALSAMACLRAARRARGGHSCSWAACSSAFAVGLACFPSCGSLPLSPHPCKAQPAPLAFPGATRGSGRGGVTLLSCL